MSYPTPPPYGYRPYGPPPEHPQATLILILGIVGLVFCQLCAPIAWVLGKRALNEIDASGGAIGGRSNVMVGYICGIIGSVFVILGILAIVAYFVFVVILFGTSSAT
ncbi:DUF4190 domain-containing protein [Nocardia sp. NPDC003345]